MVNVKPVEMGKTTRMSFARINEVLDMPSKVLARYQGMVY